MRGQLGRRRGCGRDARCRAGVLERRHFGGIAIGERTAVPVVVPDVIDRALVAIAKIDEIAPAGQLGGQPVVDLVAVGDFGDVAGVVVGAQILIISIHVALVVTRALVVAGEQTLFESLESFVFAVFAAGVGPAIVVFVQRNGFEI